MPAILNVVKSALSPTTQVGSTITYKIQITNTGTTQATNIVFFDFLPQTLSFISTSFILNGVQINGLDLAAGVAIGNLDPTKIIDISFQAIVGLTCRSRITNTCRVSYHDQDTTLTASAKYKIRIDATLFKQIDQSGIFILPCHMPCIDSISNIITKGMATPLAILSPPTAVADEAQIATTKKLIIQGTLTHQLDYQPYSSKVYFSKHFYTFILLPPDFNTSIPLDQLHLTVDIVDASALPLSCDQVFINTLFKVSLC